MEGSDDGSQQKNLSDAEPKENSERVELIKSACVEFEGEEFYGRTHIDALAQIYGRYGFPLQVDSARYGFKTTNGRFVDRYEAFEIARDGGQLTEKAAREKTGKNESLTAEDVLYDKVL